MKILITGVTGFIGKHLKKYLEDLEYDVDVITREEFENHNYEQLEVGTYKATYSKFIRIDDPIIVIHCVWPREKDLHSLEHLKFGYETCQFFEECKSRGIRVINLGSSSEYGVKFKPMRENMRCEPINTYGLAKLMVTLHAKKLGFNTLRLFTVTGEGGHSFKDIYTNAKKWSDEFQVRDYISIEMICLAIQRLIHAKHLYGEIINIGSGAITNNYNIVKYGNEIQRERWNKYPQTQYEPSCWAADITKMRKLLNL